MSRFHWNSKDIREDRDITSDSKLSTVSGSSPEVSHSGEWTTSRRELWCFYLYSIVRFGPSQFQNLLHFAGYDLSYPPFTKPCGSGSNCVLPFMGQVRNSPSFFHLPLYIYILLLWVAVMLLMIGAWADYGTWR
ncbi:hypothetical protein BJV77DRAFT_989635 [Russula vinacea]|nr:hypothetical protein BJV77DRAFT_989635 [Russula vinacea]